MIKKFKYLLIMTCITCMAIGCSKAETNNSTPIQRDDIPLTSQPIEINDDTGNFTSDNSQPAYPELAYATEEEILADKELEEYYKDNNIEPDVNDDDDPITTGVMVYNIEEIFNHTRIDNLLQYMVRNLDVYFADITDKKTQDYIVTITSDSYQEEYNDKGDLVIVCKGNINSNDQFPDKDIEIKFNTQTGRFTFITPSFGAMSYTIDEYMDQMR